MQSETITVILKGEPKPLNRFYIECDGNRYFTGYDNNKPMFPACGATTMGDCIILLRSPLRG